jgi:hypothetical protein
VNNFSSRFIFSAFALLVPVPSILGQTATLIPNSVIVAQPSIRVMRKLDISPAFRIPGYYLCQTTKVMSITLFTAFSLEIRSTASTRTISAKEGIRRNR